VPPEEKFTKGGKKMQIWKKNLILSAGFFFLGGLGISNSDSVLQMVGTAFIAIGIACLCVSTLVDFKKFLPFIRRNFLKIVVLAYLIAFSFLVIACDGKLVTVLIMWVIALPYLAKPKKTKKNFFSI